MQIYEKIQNCVPTYKNSPQDNPLPPLGLLSQKMEE